MRISERRDQRLPSAAARASALFFVPSIFVVLLFCGGSAASAGVPQQFPLAFEPNHGQWRADVRFLARSRSGLVTIDERGDIHLLGDHPNDTLRITLAGSRPPVRILGEEPLGQTHHYFVGASRETWRTGVPVYRSVICAEVYPRTDLVVHSDKNGELEYDFVLRPGADPRRIRLRFSGSSGVEIGPAGELIVRTSARSVRMKPPILYQNDGERLSRVAGRYRLRGRTVGFETADYDRSRGLIIDPVVVGYSTFLGGSDADIITAIAVDGDRNTWIAGSTMSTRFPANGEIRPAIAGVWDAFVAKLSPAGDRVVSVTFLGGRDHDTASKLSLDPQGNAYLTGATASTDFPVTGGALQSSTRGGKDAFVAKLGSDGALLFSTYLGGSAEDSGHGIAADARGNVYVAGRTLSGDFPVTAGALQSAQPGMRDGFVSKLRTDPATLLFSTYIGGSADDLVRGLALDAAGTAYVTGNTFSADYPTTAGALQTSFGGTGSGNQRFGDVFVTAIRPTGDALAYSTFIGGTNGEIGNAVAVDARGAAHVAGIAFFSGFPTTQGAYQPRHGGGQADAFALALAPEGDRLLFSTYIGGGDESGNDEAFAIAVDPIGNVHVAGTTLSPDFPTTEDAVSRQKKGAIDAFASVFSGDGSRLLYSSFIGGTAPSGGPQENGFALAVDGGGNTYVGGHTRSRDFPVSGGAIQTAYGGYEDAFLMKLTPQRQRPEGEMRVVPVTGSAPGALGSYFKTSFQLHNPRSTLISGRLVFHPQGLSGSDSDASLDYFIRPGETVSFSDLLPAMGQGGVGSVDLFASPGEVPESFIRIFNDAGEKGTTGMSLEPLRSEDALATGMTGVLLAPISVERSRFNIGIRTLEEGASVAITLRRRDGTVAHTAARTYAPHFFEQRSAEDFVGTTIQSDDSVAVRVESGSVIVYGSTTDNLTQDPSLQIAAVAASVAGEMRVIPAIGSTPGAFGSFFKTSVQLHNATSQPISGRLVYHPQNVSGSEADPALPYSIEPGQTISFDDLLPALGLSGLGSVDLISTAGPLPLSVVRIYNDAGELGTTGMTEEQIPLAEAFGEGDEGILITPVDPAKARFNIGIRTLGEEVILTATLQNAFGAAVKSVTKTFPPVYFTQMPAGALVEAEIRGNDAVRLRVDQGRAIVYGTTTDNLTQDPALKIVRRLQ